MANLYEINQAILECLDPETGETITITNTETHTVTFKGDYSLLDMTGVEYPEPEE